MATVTQRIKQITQPRGGYINPKLLEEIELPEVGEALRDRRAENINPGLVGLAVDYLTRYLSGADPLDAFSIPIRGAMLIGDGEQAASLLSGINGLDSVSITNACKLTGYDVVYRIGPMGFRPVDEIQPNVETIGNIKIMVERSLNFFRSYGPVTLDGFTFAGAFTELVTNGDGDFLTEDTLWDFKVSANGPTKEHTLQLLMYWLMGVRSGQPEFEKITRLGVFNPRLNKVFRLSTSDVPTEVVTEVSRDVIGY